MIKLELTGIHETSSSVPCDHASNLNDLERSNGQNKVNLQITSILKFNNDNKNVYVYLELNTVFCNIIIFPHPLISSFLPAEKLFIYHLYIPEKLVW